MADGEGPLAHHHDEGDQEQQARHRGQGRHHEEHEVVHPSAEVPRGYPEQDRQGNRDQTGQPSDQDRDPHALEAR